MVLLYSLFGVTNIIIATLFAIVPASIIKENVGDDRVSLEYYRKKKFPPKPYYKSLLERLRPNKIVGGVEVEEGRYPYMVALLKEDFPFCGGSLVHPEWVLSAAHCAEMSTHVLIGNHDFNDIPTTAEKIAVLYEVQHPSFNAWTLDHDMLMIRLEKPSTFDVVTLDQGDADISGDNDLTVMGWGTTQFLGAVSEVLLEVEVPTVSNASCLTSYPGDVTNTMFCAGVEGKDSCQGDSGGPIIIKGTDASSDVQVGIVSWGIGCACPGYPGVYATVAKAKEFVAHTIKYLGYPDDGFDYSACTGKPNLVGNYQCDVDNNVTECNLDGKDCKYCSYPDDGFDYSDCNVGACFIGDGICQDFSSIYTCNFDGGDCNENCFFPADDGFNYSDCKVGFPCFIGDGFCDTLGEYNTPSCNNDGGDCNNLSFTSIVKSFLDIMK